MATGFEVGDEEKARAKLLKIEERLDAGIEPERCSDPSQSGAMRRTGPTSAYRNGLSSAPDDHTRLRLHALPAIGK